MIALTAILFFQIAPGTGQPPPPELVEKLTEQADVFSYLAPRVIGQEILYHKGRRNPPRFRPRIGKAALEPPKPRYIEREIVSEYGFAPLGEPGGILREFRLVTKVDGRTVKERVKARQTLAVNMTSEDDRLRKRLLEDFEKHGQIGAVTDVGQMIQLFRRRNLGTIELTLQGTERIGADEVIRLNYRTKGEAADVFEGRELMRLPLRGELWLRSSDGVPLRISFLIETAVDKQKVNHAGSVEYFASAHGLALPAVVRYEKRMGEDILVTNETRYSEYKMFKVQAEIKFTPEETPKPQ